ncbi:MAG: glycosyltransferase [Alphaproteobacteria bacterium]|nr:glycosyltransferase [Alphaproteobacteria bacterium]
MRQDFTIAQKPTERRVKFLGLTLARTVETDACTGIRVFRAFKFVFCRRKFRGRGLKPADKPILIFDHSWGGGTESYIEQVIRAAVKKRPVIRVQAWPNKFFTAQIFKGARRHTVVRRSLRELLSDFRDNRFSEIIVNHLVNYPDLNKILPQITALHPRADQITFLGHDFWTLCPSIQLLRAGVFCNLPTAKECKKCYRKSGRFGCEMRRISDWRAMWGDFFERTVDYMVAPSEFVKNMFLRVYPDLKIRVVPHKVDPLRVPRIPRHRGLNIATIGTMVPHKGSDIIDEMARIAPVDVKIVVIGDFYGKNKSVFATGKYNRKELPDILEKHKIDMIFIPSIWPETFSYTTSEAMAMNMPVACFNFGAPAERVGAYKRGLLINKIDAEYALKKIQRFMKK